MKPPGTCRRDPSSGRGAAALVGFREAAGWIGSAPAFLRALGELEHFARVDVPVLILGETGTGKELAARAIHYLGSRSSGPFVPVNCGALPERLFENELFGHSRGAFTDAGEASSGLIAHAEGGTLLLDEVDSLDRHSQAALLRFLQDRMYRPLGAGGDRRANVRVIASSNARLAELVEDGRFRRDLLFRLDVARVELPPLRARKEDIAALARHFLAIGASRFELPCPDLGAETLLQLLGHDWPGNVRELENLMLRWILLQREGGPDEPGTADAVATAAATAQTSEAARGQKLPALKLARANCIADFERHYLASLLERANGNISAASREAKTERRYLGRLIKRHQIDPAAFRG
jgi:two-component system response regulator GlrR